MVDLQLARSPTNGIPERLGLGVSMSAIDRAEHSRPALIEPVRSCDAVIGGTYKLM